MTGCCRRSAKLADGSFVKKSAAYSAQNLLVTLWVESGKRHTASAPALAGMQRCIGGLAARCARHGVCVMQQLLQDGKVRGHRSAPSQACPPSVPQQNGRGRDVKGNPQYQAGRLGHWEELDMKLLRSLTLFVADFRINIANGPSVPFSGEWETCAREDHHRLPFT